MPDALRTATITVRTTRRRFLLWEQDSETYISRHGATMEWVQQVIEQVHALIPGAGVSVTWS